MDDGLQVMVELFQPATFIIVTLVGWGVRAIWKRVVETENKIESMRQEMHTELREYTRKETCMAHRMDFQRQIDEIRGIHRYPLDCHHDADR